MSKPFPMMIQCRRVANSYGLAYGRETDFCGQAIKVEQNDIKRQTWQRFVQHEKASGTDYGVICPECGAYVLIDSSEIPDYVKKTANEAMVMLPQQYL